MSTKVKFYWLIATLILLLLVAAQCGAVTETEESRTSAGPNTEAAGQAAEHDEEEGPNEAHDLTMNAPDLTPVELAAGEKLRIVATTNIIGDMLQNVAGDRVELDILMPGGSDPHTFQPAPQDAASVADAHLVLANGLNFEEFLDELIENAGGEAVVIRMAEGVEIRQFEEGGLHTHDDQGAEHEHAVEAGYEHKEAGHPHQEGADPHAWMTPHNALVYVRNIEAALGALDPANAEAYKANAKAYEAELEELDRWVFEQIETIPPDKREMVTDHDTFGYYAGRYGLDIIGAVIPSYSTAAEPSAQELAELEEIINEFNVPAIFVGSTVSPNLAERVATDTGTKLVPLYTGSLGPEGSGAETYLDYIRYNTTAIVEGLRP